MATPRVTGRRPGETEEGHRPATHPPLRLLTVLPRSDAKQPAPEASEARRPRARTSFLVQEQESGPAVQAPRRCQCEDGTEEAWAAGKMPGRAKEEEAGPAGTRRRGERLSPLPRGVGSKNRPSPF